MKHILCYGDSNTYGLSPEWVHGKFGRHDYSVRWPGRLQALLGPEYRIIEEGLSGRTTVFEDYVTPYRNGADYLRPCLETHAPLDLVILMLGTNDCRNQFGVSPGEIAMGLGRLIQIVKDPSAYMGMPVPKVLVAVPVPVGEAALKLPDGITTMESIEKSRATCTAASTSTWGRWLPPRTTRASIWTPRPTRPSRRPWRRRSAGSCKRRNDAAGAGQVPRPPSGERDDPCDWNGSSVS